MAKVENSFVVIKGLIEENNENLDQIEKKYWKLEQTCKMIKLRDLIDLLMGLIDLIKGLIEREIAWPES
jgi:hypothetical protein